MIEKTPLQRFLLIFSMIFIGSLICLSGHFLTLFIETIVEINDTGLDPFRDEPQIFFTLLGSMLIPPLIGISVTGVITHGINLIAETKATGRTMQPVPDIKIALLRVSLIILMVTGIILFMDVAAFIADNADILYDNTSVDRLMRSVLRSAELEDAFLLPLVLPLLITSPYIGTVFIFSTLIFTFFVLPAAHLCLAHARNDFYLNSLKREQKERTHSISTSSQSITITKPTPTITKPTSSSHSKPNVHDPDSFESRLQQLDILRDSGLISPAEYTEQYQRLLNKK